MATILAISGSLRHNSLNTRLLKAMAQYVPRHIHFNLMTLVDIPLYNGDIEERQGVPQAVQHLKQQMMAAEGILISTPEYNHGMPGVLKNAIDWCTRPTEDIAKVFHGRKIGLLGASPGRFGTAFAQVGLLPTLRYLKVEQYDTQLYVSEAHKIFDANGLLTDSDSQVRLKNYINGFIDFIQKP